MECVYINVGGTLFQTNLSTLQKYPDTLLGSLTISSEFYNKAHEQFYFDRNPELFNTVLDYYRHDIIHLPTHLCGWLWKSELEFWRIPLSHISECCFQTYVKYDKKEATAAKLRETFTTASLENSHLLSPFNKIRHRVWLFIDKPASSMYARIFSIIFLITVVVSAIIPCLQTYPNIRIQRFNGTMIHRYSILNPDTWLDPDNEKEVLLLSSYDPSWLYNLNLFTMIFFTLESLVRFISCPSKCRFFLEWLNVLDLFLNIVMWSRFIIDWNITDDIAAEDHEKLMHFLSFCSAASVLRLLKLFRVANQYNSLRILFLAVRSSFKELGLLLLTFLIIAWVFSNLIYYAEIREPDTFPNMLDGLWWSVVTMTTIGYGDMYPKGPLGRVVGAICAMIGILVIAMPIAVIAGNFDELHKTNNERESYNRIHKEKETERKESIYSITSKENKIIPCKKSKEENKTGNFLAIKM